MNENLNIKENINDKEVIELLCNQNIICVFGGSSESGRRALGNRSILADPRNNNMKDIINKKVKHRQWFRPFAPSILDCKLLLKMIINGIITLFLSLRIKQVFLFY